MKRDYYRTSDLARAAGVHPNTVRLYEQWGFLPPADRGANGYRQFSTFHLEQLRLARLVLHGGWPGRQIRRSAVALVMLAAGGDLAAALNHARRHLSLVRAERAQAEAAAAVLARWQEGGWREEPASKPLRIKETAVLLNLTQDILRNWEKNGLVAAPREPGNGYRLYGAEEIARLRVIRLLLRAGFGLAAVLRALNHLDAGRSGDARAVLDTPPLDEEIEYSTDRWLTTLREQEERARAIVAQVEAMRQRYGT